MSGAAFASQTKFADRIADLMGRVDYRIASTGQEREEIYRLRYEAYRREGTIAADPSHRFCDAYDGSDNATIFGAYVEGELVSSVRIHIATRDYTDFPSRGAFGDILVPELEAGRIVVDSTRFVTDRDFSKRFVGLHFVTLRLCWMAVEHVRADHFLAAVRAEHQAFYKRTFRHRPVCPPRPYALLKSPICLMSVGYEDAVGHVHQRYPFLRSNAFERRMLFQANPAGFQIAGEQRRAA